MIEDFLRNEGVQFEVIHHEQAYTAQETAAAEHVSGYMFAKTVVVTDGDKYYILVLPATCHVDLENAGELIGQEVRLASEQEMGPLFSECEVGAQPPFGSLYNTRTFADSSLEAQRHIVFRAGTHQKTIKMLYQDYADLEKPVVGSFSSGE